MSEHVILVKESDGDDEWIEHSRHASRDEALSAMRGALISEEEPWTTAKIGAELYVLTPQRSVLEIMED